MTRLHMPRKTPGLKAEGESLLTSAPTFQTRSEFKKRGDTVFDHPWAVTRNERPPPNPKRTNQVSEGFSRRDAETQRGEWIFSLCVSASLGGNSFSGPV